MTGTVETEKGRKKGEASPALQTCSAFENCEGLKARPLGPEQFFRYPLCGECPATPPSPLPGDSQRRLRGQPFVPDHPFPCPRPSPSRPATSPNPPGAFSGSSGELSGLLGAFSGSSGDISESFLDVSESFLDVSESFLDVSESFLDVSESFLDVSESFLDVSESFLDVSESFLDVSESFLDVSESFLDVSESFLDVSESFLDVSESFRDLPESSEHIPNDPVPAQNSPGQVAHAYRHTRSGSGPVPHGPGAVPGRAYTTPRWPGGKGVSCKRRKHRRAGLSPLLVVLGLCGILAAACATTSPSAGEDEALEEKLPPGAALYGFANMRQLEPVIKNMEQFNNKQMADFIKKTEFAVFGLYRDAVSTNPSVTRNVFLVTRGNYPAASYNFALSLSPKWKSTTIDGKKWWKQGATALSIGKNEAYVRLGDIPVPVAAHPQPSYEERGVLFAHARRSLKPAPGETPIVLASFIPSAETASLIRSLGVPLDIRLESITLTVAANGEAYHSTIRLKTKSPSEAKALSAILSLARTRIRRDSGSATDFIAALLFENPPALDTSAIVITGTFPLETLIHSIKMK